MSEILKSLNWRYATQTFDPSKKLSKEDLNELLEVMRLAPSSFGLQPWRFIIVEDTELRKRISEKAWNQPKVTDASHLIVLCAKTDMSEDYIQEFINDMARTRNVEHSSLKGYHDMLLNFRKGHTKETMLEWSKRQVYIPLGMLLLASAMKKIDAGPMEGFDPVALDEILDLKKEGFTSTVLCAIGYRSKDDKYAEFQRVRHPTDKIIEKR